MRQAPLSTSTDGEAVRNGSTSSRSSIGAGETRPNGPPPSSLAASRRRSRTAPVAPRSSRCSRATAVLPARRGTSRVTPLSSKAPSAPSSSDGLDLARSSVAARRSRVRRHARDVRARPCVARGEYRVRSRPSGAGRATGNAAWMRAHGSGSGCGARAARACPSASFRSPSAPSSSSRCGSVPRTGVDAPSSVSFMISAPAPITQSRRDRDAVAERRVHADEAVVADRDVARDDGVRRDEAVVARSSTSCPMWLPLQRTTSFPIVTNGWITFFSKTKTLSPISTSPRRSARELT